jgi:AcrR family transcriptional regulator
MTSQSAETEQAFESPLGVSTQRASDQGQESYDDRLNRILVAATDVIARVGYERATMRLVARAAGVSLAGMYHYFDSKERMLFLIEYRTFNALVTKLRENLLGVEDAVEQLRTMIRTHVNYFAANMAALKVCSHELDSLSGASYEETRRLRHDYYGIARSIVERLLEGQVGVEGIDRHIATMSLFGMLNWLYRWYNPQRGRAPNAVANQLTGQFLRGLLGSGNGGAANGSAATSVQTPPETAEP